MTSDRWSDTSLLSRLDIARQPWESASRRIVTAVLNRFLPRLDGPIVEIGAGDGQLRRWLPPMILHRVTHSEPSATFLDALTRRHPDATTLQADAATLPFPDRSVSAILGLCVLDAVPDLSAVRDECRRVLSTGGMLIHFLDLSTNPDAAFAELLAGGETPLPNFTQEPGLLEECPATMRSRLPQTDEFDEILAADGLSLARTLAALRAARHPLVEKLGDFGRLHEAGRLDPLLHGQAYMRARAEPDASRELSRALLASSQKADEIGCPLRLRGVSLRAHFRERLRREFSEAHGFAIELAGPVTVRERTHADRNVLRHAGRTLRRRQAIPLPGLPVEHLEDVSSHADFGAQIRATTIEVLAARRVD